MTKKPLILVVDDEEDFLEIMRVHLSALGFEADTLLSDDVAEIVRRCEEISPDAALLDLYFAGAPVGVDIALALRDNPRTHDVKVLMWSSASFPPGIAADYFIDKGSDLSLVTREISRALGV